MQLKKIFYKPKFVYLLWSCDQICNDHANVSWSYFFLTSTISKPFMIAVGDNYAITIYALLLIRMYSASKQKSPTIGKEERGSCHSLFGTKPPFFSLLLILISVFIIYFFKKGVSATVIRQKLVLIQLTYVKTNWVGVLVFTLSFSRIVLSIKLMLNSS